MLTEYYDNGQLKTETPYDEFGRLDGESRHYFPSGELQASLFYRQGLLQGDFTLHYKSGAVRSISSYKDDLLPRRSSRL